MDHFEALKLYCQIVDAGGMAKAARVLGVSPATVTQGLAQLERHYDTSLLERTTRKMLVTESGKLLYLRAKTLIEDLGNTEEEVRGSSTTPKGNLRITLPLGVAQSFIYPRLTEFTEKYPDIKLDLQVSDQVLDLVAGNYDIGLRAGILADASVIAIPLLRYRRLTCASPYYLARYGHPLHPQELRQHTCLVYRHDALPVSWDYWIEQTVTSITVQGSYASNESNALLAMARAGLGITRQPDWLVNQDLRQGSLVSVLESFNAPSMLNAPGIYAVIQKRQYRSAKIDAFIEFARAVISEASSSGLG